MTDRRRLDRFTGHCGGGCCTASLARQDGDGAQAHPGTHCGNDHAQGYASPAGRLDDGARAKMIERAVGNLAVVCLSSGQAEPYRQSLRVDDNVDLGRKAASGATETMIWLPFSSSHPAGAPGWKCYRSSGSRRRTRR